jgi:sec-independent protein translocase protein TatB
MANIGMADTLILMVLALVVFGPRRLPQIGRQIGKLMYEFRKASNDFKFQMEEELRQSEEADRRQREEAARQAALAAAPPVPQLAPIADNAPVTSESTSESLETPAASPYPGESAYPDAATQPEDATAAAVGAARLRIQPPSTGEVVAANAPGAVSQPSAPATEAAASENLSGANEAERSEPATHHG